MKVKGFQLNIEIPEKDIENMLKQSGMLDEIEAGFAADHATAVEYGQMPGTTPPYDAIEFWVRKKLNVTDKSEIAKITSAVIEGIYRKGTRPQPFFAPAVNTVASKLQTYDIANEGMYRIGQAIINEARDNIVEKGISHTYALENSRYVRRKP